MSYGTTFATWACGHLSGRVGVTLGSEDQAPDGTLPAVLSSSPGVSWIEPNPSVIGESWADEILGAAGDMPVVSMARIGRLRDGETGVVDTCSWASWRILEVPESWVGVDVERIAEGLGGHFPMVDASELWFYVPDESILEVTPRWLSDIRSALNWSMTSSPICTLFATPAASNTSLDRLTAAAAGTPGAWRVEVRS